MKKKLIVLTFLSHYIPSYKSGGPLRSIANMVDHLAHDIEFWIVTSDRDLGDTDPFSAVNSNKWQKVGGAYIYYVSPSEISIKNISRIISTTPHDILYLNSFFDPKFAIRPLLSCLFFGSTNRPIILAPRGEFSSGALTIKKSKKAVYIFLSRILGFYRRVVFHASTAYESKDIALALKFPISSFDGVSDSRKTVANTSGVIGDRIRIAIDLPNLYAINPPSPLLPHSFSGLEALKVVFLSRISEKKNLDYALKVLMNVKSDVVFDIYGPLEDPNYWDICKKLISCLPKNITATYCGAVMPEDVSSVFVRYDMFFFPTKGENYGHVIAESVSVGTPVLLSDQTPWVNLEHECLGWDFPLEFPARFSQEIDRYANLSEFARFEFRATVQGNAIKLLRNPDAIQANLDLFLSQM